VYWDLEEILWSVIHHFEKRKEIPKNAKIMTDKIIPQKITQFLFSKLSKIY
jgi:hypothetical protein